MSEATITMTPNSWRAMASSGYSPSTDEAKGMRPTGSRKSRLSQTTSRLTVADAQEQVAVGDPVHGR